MCMLHILYIICYTCSNILHMYIHLIYIRIYSIRMIKSDYSKISCVLKDTSEEFTHIKQQRKKIKIYKRTIKIYSEEFERLQQMSDDCFKKSKERK